VSAYRRYFGSWSAALAELGLKPWGSRRYTNDELVGMLRDLADDLGHAPTHSELKARDELPASSTFRRRFGSWRGALQAAGLCPAPSAALHLSPSNRGYDCEMLLDELREIVEELGRAPVIRELPKFGAAGKSTYQRYFGSWSAALKQLGVEPAVRRYTRDELLDALHDLANDLGRSPYVSEMDARHDLPASDTFKTRFGSWNDALAEAGLPVHAQKEVYDRDTLLEQLRGAVEQLGRVPAVRELRELGCADYTTYRSHFGSWKAALKELGLEPHGSPRYGSEELLRMLRDLARELGHVPSGPELDAQEGLPAAVTYGSRFGSWNNALREAGLTPRYPSPKTEDS